MTVQEVMKLLIELPMDATVTVATSPDDLNHIESIGVIPEGPLGIYKPHLVYIELGEIL